MDKKQKILLIIIGLIMLGIIGLAAYNVLMPKPEVLPNDIEISQRTQDEEPAATNEAAPKEYINVYFIGRNSRNEEVYKAVKREYNSDVDGSKIRFAINTLIKGPKQSERKYGVYTEIPADSQVINITEYTDKVVINLNSSFVTGGGADSLYKRLYQLIKTAKLNSSKPVYLYIDGQKADVVGGEGIMLTQPLDENSLEN